MEKEDKIEAAILEHLAGRSSCTMKELASLLPDCTLSQVLFTVDRLALNGELVLRRPLPFASLVSPVFFGPRPSSHHQDIRPVG